MLRKTFELDEECSRLRLDDRNVGLDCEVLAVDPRKTLSYTWNHSHADAAYDLKSVVTFTFTPTSTGTRLRMEQSGFRPDQKQAFGGAKAEWRQFFANLEQVLVRID